MNDWFEWNGERSSDHGFVVLTQPNWTAAMERVSYADIPGRSGSLTVTTGENVFDDKTFSCSCVMPNPDDVDSATTWLRGEGKVRFAKWPEGYFKGRMSSQLSFSQIVRGNPHLAFSVQFRVRPYMYLDSGDETLILDANESDSIMLTNPGNCPSKPLLKVYGNGEGTIMLSSGTMIINSFDGIDYMLIDNEAELIYKGRPSDPTDPLMLLTSRATGDWLTIPVGNSFLMVTGGITRVEITPRWVRV